MYLVVQVAAKPPKQNHLPPIQPAPQNLENKAPIPEQTTNEHEQPVGIGLKTLTIKGKIKERPFGLLHLQISKKYNHVSFLFGFPLDELYG